MEISGMFFLARMNTCSAVGWSRRGKRPGSGHLVKIAALGGSASEIFTRISPDSESGEILTSAPTEDFRLVPAGPEIRILLTSISYHSRRGVESGIAPVA